MLQLPPFAEDVAEEIQPSYDYTIPLGDDTFRIVLRYRERQDRWYVSLYDSDDEPITLGRMLTVDTPVLADLVMDGRPAGDLMLFDTSLSGEECSFEGLGTVYELVYFTVEDVPEPSTADVTIEAVP